MERLLDQISVIIVYLFLSGEFDYFGAHSAILVLSIELEFNFSAI